jgi:2-dehydro-3-deoxyphosphogluconate aldolase/(4S)-4-hydroxy-2-oxoglutarate aldolase
MPTGGVNLETAAAFLRAGATALGVGGSLVDAQAIANREFAKIEERARQFVSLVDTTLADIHRDE